jgi:DNA helicase HerA-like ATPase
VIKHAEVLLNKEDLDAKADAYLQYLNDRFVEGDGHQIGGEGPRRRATSLRELVSIIQDQIRWAEQKNTTQIDSHSFLTARKMYNRINNLGGRFAGLIAENGLPSGPFDDPFEPNTVYVVDVAGLDSDSQDLVFAGFITTLREKMEAGELGVGRLVVMVDELNKYAPSNGTETYVVRSLREIAARGRYLGLTLFGAQQFRSRVDREIVGNAATHAFGHMEVEELSNPVYSYFTPAVKEKLGALKPGEVLLKHPHFAQPVFVNFPVPACMKGQDGLRRYPLAKPLPVQDLIVNEIKRLKADVNQAKAAMDGLSQDQRDLRELLRNLRNAAVGADAVAIVKYGRREALRSEAKAVVDDSDPFAELLG